MKKILLITVCLLFGICSNGTNSSLAIKGSTGESITIFSSPDLLKLAQVWVNEYSKLNPNVDLELRNILVTKYDKTQIKGEVIFFVSSEYQKQVINDQSLKIIIGTDAIVPIISESNPYVEKISKLGVSIEKLTKLLSSPEKQSWGELFGDLATEKINLYVLNEGSVIHTIKGLSNTNDLSKLCTVVSDPDALLAKIRNDKNAVGFCKLSNTTYMGVNEKGFLSEIKLIPIDFNKNNVIDYNENFYNNPLDFTRGLMIGKYPKILTEDIYLVTPERPTSESQLSFITWILTDGQKSLNLYGYADLAYNQRKSAIDNLAEANAVNIGETKYSYVIPFVLILIVALIGLFFTIDFALYKIKNARTKHNISMVVESNFNENTVEALKGLFYDKTHTWSYMRKTGVVEVGIDDFLQHITGPVTKFKMKSPGEKIRKGEILISIIQNGKQVNIYSPISGEIKESNLKLNNDTTIFNSSPYSEGWIYVIEPSNWIRETQFMVLADKYKEWIKTEYIRLKDFLTNSLKENTLIYNNVATLQDGGEIKEHVLQNLSPEVWEDFQTKFIDTSR